MPQPNENERGATLPQYEEHQMFTPWVYVLLTLIGAAGAADLLTRPGLAARIVLGGYLLLFALISNLLALTTVVTNNAVHVTFGWAFPLYRRVIALADIARAEAVTYSPLREYGGWGIRGRGENVALNARGNRGVRLTLTDGRRVLIGSQRPFELADALSPDATADR